MKATTIGLDLAKRVMHAVAMDETGQVLWRQRYSRPRLLASLAQLPACRVAMECGSSAHYWGRELEALGHRAVLIPAQHVRPYRAGNKHDYNDAQAIAEAATRASTPTVPVKRVAEQDIQALHRLRAGYVRQRTTLINQWRGLVAEYGQVLPQGPTAFRRQAPAVLAELEGRVSARLWHWLSQQLGWLRQVDAQITALERDLKRLLREDERARRLQEELAGVGLLTATALVARLGDGGRFRRARDCAAWLGVVPGQHSSGGKTRLRGITRRGDPYLRTLLIHGGRTVVRHARGKDDPFNQWVNRLRERRGVNVAAVAVANKNARMAWAILNRQAQAQTV